jgi:hypothetical protein
MNKPAHPVDRKNRIPTATERLVAIQLATIGLVLAVGGVISLKWMGVTSLFPVMAIFAIAIFMFIQAARVLQVDPNITLALIALALACVSSAYQPLGPEIGLYGTECVPIEDCSRALRGGGLPLQYAIDIPGITTQGRLGIEDEFRALPFALDILFYFVLVQIVHRLKRVRTAYVLSNRHEQ